MISITIMTMQLVGGAIPWPRGLRVRGLSEHLVTLPSLKFVAFSLGGPEAALARCFCILRLEQFQLALVVAPHHELDEKHEGGP